MHGREGEERKRGRHMWTGPNRVNSVVVAGDDFASCSLLSPPNSFSKDGRKISVGDCALFKPPQDSPPFIGIIRWLTTGKEKELRLCVNWLYRPSEVKLGKGILLDAAPNEVFYSFHKDEIPAASLLHPCKVAFLAKGDELPSGICSFVCRRVYDVTNKCLWWLTDQDYINDRQEEVDQLLYKSRLEMHATVQSGGRSPKPMNGPTSTSQLKPTSESIHNSSSSFPSQVKGKKRERIDQGSEPVKRERSTKMDDGDSSNMRTESSWKSEIAKFTEKGGLVDSEGVEKLVQLMLPERTDRKIDLVGRSLLAGVIAATDKFDCVNRFVQLRGLAVFDEWLQEVHKGKIGDGNSPKDNDKSIEEFLLVLLRALDKLPVNLHALQMCNIGKSVNHLRTHKNLEIQKKARSLVDTWKKRVEAEMDAKSGSNHAVSWAARQRLPEVSHGGSRHSALSSEVAIKSSAAQLSASKSAPLKLVQAEPTTKSVSAPLASMKSAPSSASVGNNLKEGHPRNTGVGGVCDPPLTIAGDEKSSGSSQSHNNSQSCSSDHAKTGGHSGKEDARSSAAVSMTTNKIIGISSRHRKSMNGFPGPTSSAVQKETGGSSRNSPAHRNQISEKLPQSSLTCEKVADVPMAEGNNNHKLIVKLSNRGRSPARSVSGGSFEDPSIMTSRASSPVQHDQFDRSLKDKNDTCRVNLSSDVNAESWQSNDFKEVLTGSDEGDGSPVTLPEEDNSRTADDTRKLAEVSKAASSSSGNECKSVKLHEASFSSMNALIESCVKYSETNTSISGADDVGMNLLASVATGEMASPTPSPQRNIGEHSCTSGDSRIKSSPGDNLAPERGQLGEHEHEKRIINASNVPAKNTEGKPMLSPKEKLMAEVNGHLNSSSMDVQQVSGPCIESNIKCEDKIACTSLTVLATRTVEKSSIGKGMKQWEKPCSKLKEAVQSVPKEDLGKSSDVEDEVKVPVVVGTEAVTGSFPHRSSEIDNENMKNTCELKVPGQGQQKLSTAIHSKSPKGNGGEILHCSDSRNDVISENVDVIKGDCVESLTVNQGSDHIAGPISSEKLSPKVQNSEQQQAKSGGSRLTGIEADETEECTSAVKDRAAGDSNKEAKLEFNLNEGFNGDDGRYGELNNLRVEGSTGVQLISPLPLPVSSGSSALPASITVASAAKRPFVPPEDLLKNKVELGWKGSAATSAFRPAEPRKSLELPLATMSNSVPDVPAAKAARPPLDIDLNVPDERIHDDMAFRSTIANSRDLSHGESMGSVPVRNSGGLDLDLNRMDEPIDMVTSNGHRLDMQFQPIKSLSGGVHKREASIRRDFDLNDGPLVDEVGVVEPSSFGQHTRISVVPTHSQPSVSTLRINNAEIGNFSSWFNQGNPYSAVTIQSALSDRGEQSFPVVTPGGPQRMLASSAVSTTTPFTPDVYRGPVLSSSPAVPFPSAPFQYPVFSFGNFPLHSTTFSGGGPTPYVDSTSGGRICFPAVHSQVLGPPPGAVQSHYTRPFLVGLPDSNNRGAPESSRKWGRQGLDLNTGPLSPDREGRDETSSSLASRQLSVANSQAIAEEQSRMFQVAGGAVLKRKEPDGGWEGYKQSPWQ
ncbi:BAH domain TFIIS helical bundle-like domain [Euphorbia peplus]|nr:BAH domain TFIIS helical bundle-like domain [Euphorbia peplus]